MVRNKQFDTAIKYCPAVSVGNQRTGEPQREATVVVIAATAANASETVGLLAAEKGICEWHNAKGLRKPAMSKEIILSSVFVLVAGI